MYDVSEEFKAAAAAPVSIQRVLGSVDTVDFSDENILKGSLTISNQCSDTSAFALGAVYIGELTCTFLNLPGIARSSWVGRVITLQAGLLVGEDYEYVPLGAYTVSKATHDAGMVTVTAYDNMSKFDREISADAVGSAYSLYGWLSLACVSCGVTLGLTQAESEALPNGTATLTLYEQGDIETWRDLLSWLALCSGSFATINRAGELVLRTWHQTADDAVSAQIRYETSYGDEAISYTTVSVTVTASEAEERYSAAPDDGYALALGGAPFMQGGFEERETLARVVLGALGAVDYKSCRVSVPFGAHYDLGDVLQFPGGSGSNDLCCLMYYEWTYGADYTISGIPAATKAATKADKQSKAISTRLSASNVMTILPVSTDDSAIADGESNTVLTFVFEQQASSSSAWVTLHAMINFEIETTVDDETYGDCEVTVRYVLDDVVIATQTVTYGDGEQVLTMDYLIQNPAAGVHVLEISLEPNGGNIA